MKRLSRHTVVVLLVALASCVGGMSIAVVAFGQSADPDAGVPRGDFTGTTPPGRGQPAVAETIPLNAYTATVPSTETTPVVTTVTQTPAPAHTTTQTSTQAAPVNAQSAAPTRRSTAPTSVSPTPVTPSTATRRGPSHLAFTGGEPIWIGTAGVLLMLSGVGLQRRRVAARRTTTPA